MSIAIQILLTVLSLGYSLIPSIADFNPTHATNPQWTGHARFHCVWQVVSYNGLALLNLSFIWFGVLPEPLSMIIPLVISAIIYAAFFSAVFARHMYGGLTHDTNGYPPFKGPFGIWIDVNISIFSTMALAVVVTAVLIARAI